jgi:hypothetical protein
MDMMCICMSAWLCMCVWLNVYWCTFICKECEFRTPHSRSYEDFVSVLHGVYDDIRWCMKSCKNACLHLCVYVPRWYVHVSVTCGCHVDLQLRICILCCFYPSSHIYLTMQKSWQTSYYERATCSDLAKMHPSTATHGKGYSVLFSFCC